MRTRDDVDRVRRVVEERCQTIGRKVALVVNYDDFLIDAAVADTYAAMVRYMETHYYTTASRYTTSAFLRLKLGEALSRRRVAPHIFETAEEAHAFVEPHGTQWKNTPVNSQARDVLGLIRSAGNPEYWQMTPAQARDWHNRKSGLLDVQAEDGVQGRGSRDPRRRRRHSRCASIRRASPRMLFRCWSGCTVADTWSAASTATMRFAARWLCRPIASSCRSTTGSRPSTSFLPGVLDSFVALTWVGRHAEEIGADPARIAVGGDSAGANLAAVCAILARDGGFPPLVFQLLVYPRTAPHEELQSHHDFAEGYLLTRKTILWFHNHYLRDDEDRTGFSLSRRSSARTCRDCRRRWSSSASAIRCATTASRTPSA